MQKKYSDQKGVFTKKKKKKIIHYNTFCIMITLLYNF